MSDDSFKTMPRPVHAGPAVPGGRKRNSLLWQLFGVWAWSPVVSFQVGLTLGYAALVYFGVAAMIASPPSFDDFSPDGYAFFWALGLALGAIVAVPGSVSRKKSFELIETAGASLLTLTVGSYVGLLHFVAYAAGDADRIAGAAGFAALALPIIVRTMWLYSQLLRK